MRAKTEGNVGREKRKRKRRKDRFDDDDIQNCAAISIMRLACFAWATGVYRKPQSPRKRSPIGKHEIQSSLSLAIGLTLLSDSSLTFPLLLSFSPSLLLSFSSARRLHEPSQEQVRRAVVRPKRQPQQPRLPLRHLEQRGRVRPLLLEHGRRRHRGGAQ